MRALTASIITAGSLIGLGLASIGLGLRYQAVGIQDPTKIVYIRFNQLDTPMMLIIVFLLIMATIGVVAFYLGLAYHHERRHHERLHMMSKGGESLGSRIGP
jgi:hypothetical protein